jgi:hypothetical protein
MVTDILFLHCSTSDVTIQNYELIKKHNPNKKIYPIGFENHDLLNGSHIVERKQEYPNNCILNEMCGNEYWSEADLLIYDFYIHYPTLPSYLVLEWDTYCNCSLESFYNTSLNLDTFSHIIHTESDINGWYWYDMLTDEQKLIPNIGGTTPTSGLFFKNSVLSDITKKLLEKPHYYNNMFSELRLGTLLQQSGYKLTTPFIDSDRYINWDFENIVFDPTQNGYYHPIKTLV